MFSGKTTLSKLFCIPSGKESSLPFLFEYTPLRKCVQETRQEVINGIYPVKIIKIYPVNTVLLNGPSYNSEIRNPEQTSKSPLRLPRSESSLFTHTRLQVLLWLDLITM